MKNLIKRLLKESLEEMSIKPKKEFGKGTFHKVYSSNRNPDRLYKIGDEDTVDEWVDTFKEYPQYFPKIYRVFSYSKDPSLKVVEIEKYHSEVVAIHLFEDILPQFESPRFRIQLQNSFFSVFF